MRTQNREAHIDESQSRAHENGQISVPSRTSDGGIQYSLKAEERILKSISARAPIAEVLNEICGALDCQIANIASLIFLPSTDARESAANEMNAILFGVVALAASHDAPTAEDVSSWVSRAVQHSEASC